MDAATLELLGLREAGWWAFVESAKAALGLMALALGGFSLLAVALAASEWAGHRRAAVEPAQAAFGGVETVAPRARARRLTRARTRRLVRHLAAHLACPVRASAHRVGPAPSPTGLPIHLVARATIAGRW